MGHDSLALGLGRGLKKVMSSAAGLTAALLNILSLGAGYAYCGKLFRAGLTLALSFGAFFLFSYLSAFNAWFVILGGAAIFLMLLIVAFDSFRTALTPLITPRIFYAGIYVLIFVLGFLCFVFPERRVIFNVITETTMEPALVPGDHYALDRDFAAFKVGDLVVAEREDQTLIIRRIQEMKSSSVILTTDSKAHSQTEEVPLVSLHGKIVYVLYSTEPDSWTVHWDRLLLAVN